MSEKKILLVDDEELILKALSKDLREKGYAVTAVDNGYDALTNLKKEPYDLIVTDLIMEGLDGIQVLKGAKKFDADVSVVILTAYGDLPSAIDALRLGADEYLLKPCESDELFFRISRCLETRELRKKIKKHTLDIKKTNEELKFMVNKCHRRERELHIRNEIAEIFLTTPEEAMYAKTLKVVLDALESKYGVFSYIDEKGNVVCPSMTREVWDKCQMPDKTITFHPGEWGGIWGRCLKEKKTLYSNKHFNVPEGHIPITKVLCVPILHQGKLIGHFKVANKKEDYNEQDVALLETVARHIAPVLNARLQRDRKEQERRRAEDALKGALQEVERLTDRLQKENVYLQDEIKQEHNFEEIISRNQDFNEILDKVTQVAPTDSTVLILGETGTGKELLARAIHNTSERRDRPLVKVDCASLPANLIESELFGHECGAFTGARARKTGRFELADGGTVFLDEIGDLPLELQTKLLRVLQDGEFERLGSSHPIKVDVRVIAATNRDLEKAVEAGYFRQDLYYRLNVFPIMSLPLRDRKDDIPLLVSHFINKFSAKVGKRIENVPQDVLDSLQTYHWPGNIRELENIVERAVILSRGATLELDKFNDRTLPQSNSNTELTTLGETERFLIQKALDECNWVIEGERGAAARLDIAPSTLRDRIKKYGIKKSTQ